MKRVGTMAGVAVLLALPLPLATIGTSAGADRGARVGGPTVDVDPKRFGASPSDAAFGAFQRGLYLTALDLALPRAEKGDAAAQTLVAEIYARGLGVRRDDKKAAELYEKAAAQDDNEDVARKAKGALAFIQQDIADEQAKSGATPQ